MTLRKGLRAQADICTALGSPFTGRVLNALAEVLQPGTRLTNRLFDWPGDTSAAGDSVPLRLAAALHDIVLSNADATLAMQYPPHPASTNATLAQAISDALRTHCRRIDAWIDRPPQTNEVGRSAVLIALGHWLAREFALPIVLSELGASAGLNLNWDKYALRICGQSFGPDNPTLTLSPEWHGEIPARSTLCVSQKFGTDLTPIDPTDPAAAQRLLAYIWPDQPDRIARSRAAISVADTKIDQADAADWLAHRLSTPLLGQTHLIYHTIAWQYFAPVVRARATEWIENAGANATPESPIAWFGLEADGRSPGASMSLRLWPGNRFFNMGRADFHGRWVDWQPKEGTLHP